MKAVAVRIRLHDHHRLGATGRLPQRMIVAAQRAQIDPRQLSFTYACNIVLDGYPKVLSAPTAPQQQQELERIIELVSRCRLPKRTKTRSYPREVWGRGYRFPVRRREKN